MASACLVIGGGGFIGAHLVPRLIRSRRKVTVVGRSPRPSHELPPEADYIAGDFGDADFIGPFLETHGEIVHLAYATIPNTSFENPLADLLQNLPPTVQLFEKVAAQQGHLVLVSSGGTVYGEAESLPISETHPTNPVSPYGVTKLTLEKYAHLYAVTHGLKVTCVRPGNAIGEGQRPFAGQGFVTTAMAAIMQGKPVTIYGEKGTIRDYIHAGDIANGIVAILQQGIVNETYNIGTGTGLSNLDVVEQMRSLMREICCEPKVEHVSPRVFDVHVNILDSSKLLRHTGWQPRISFSEGLLRTRNWLQTLHG